MATIDIDRAIEMIQGFIDDVIPIVEKNVEISAMDLHQKIETRILQRGIDAEGGSFSPYSKRYDRFKKKEGKHVGFVNFKFSGEMLNSIGIVERKTTGNKFVVTITGRDEHIRRLMEYNDTNRPGWFRPSKQEEEEAAADFDTRISQELEQRFQ